MLKAACYSDDMTKPVKEHMTTFNKAVICGLKIAWFAAMIPMMYEIGERVYDKSVDKLEERNFIDFQYSYEQNSAPLTQGALGEAYSYWKNNVEDVPDFYKMGKGEIKEILQNWASEANTPRTKQLNAVFLAASMRVKLFKELNTPEYTRMSAISDITQEIAKYFYHSETGKEQFQTIKDVLQEGGGDCDSIERIAHHLLLQAGIDKGQIKRGIIYKSGAPFNHMVTFVFEGNSNDPWVIDSTGAATEKVIKMSEVKDWHVEKIADMANIYNVKKIRAITTT